MVKRLDNLIHGSAPASKWDNGSGPSGPSGSNSSNWDMINHVIEENEGNDWYIPKEDRVNAWTCPVNFTVGNIDQRDFELERKFADMRHKRVEEYDQKWEEARDRNDTDYLSKHCTPGLSSIFWDSWTQEEKDYYSNEDRFQHLKDSDEIPMWERPSSKPNWWVNQQKEIRS